MRILMSLAISVLGCSTGQSGSSNSGACQRSDAGTAYTPGVVPCAGVADCPIGSCFACSTGSAGPFEQRCGAPPANTPCFAIGCDGPEDCATGNACWSFEGRSCSDQQPAGGFVQVCHTDLDCDCSQHCLAGECR